MTHAEVYAELERDRETVTVWWRHHLDTLRRPVLKARQLPFMHWADYTSPDRRIRYLFFTRIFDKRMRRILTGIAVPHRTPEGTAVYTTWLSDQRLISPMVILPHAWQRYRERTGCELTGDDLYRSFFSRNPHGSDSRNQEAVARSVRYLGKPHLSDCISEGVLLGQVEQPYNIFVAHTFITYDMASGLQAEDFNAHRQQILTAREMYEQAREWFLKREEGRGKREEGRGIPPGIK